MTEKLKLAVYWGAACGGCDVAILDTDEKILDIAAAADIVFWPLATDFKYDDVSKMEPGSIDVCLYHGAVRTSEQEEIAKLLRERSKIMVAFGACAAWGGIPGLANLVTRKEIFDSSYQDTFTTVNENNVRPVTRYEAPQGELYLPEIYNRVWSLDQVVDVDYYVPGCPPTKDTIWAAVEAIITGNLPPKGSVIGSLKSKCDTCTRERTEKMISEFKRPFEIIPDTEKCLLEQGIICCGPVTRDGCGHRCTNVNMPCRGCYGPSEKVTDQGAKLLSAIASILDAKDEKSAQELAATWEDPAGTIYRFSLAKSLIFDYKKGGE
ncbi:MAG: oxidoreductase [Clostridia bacterium]|nr:oxidoreductase [Clostridia bacterium]